jgi:NAD(P)H dehydrogenase (quinone)
MIAVSGANGQLGRGVLSALLSRLPAHLVVATVRDPAQAEDLKAPGVQVRPGDFNDRAGLSTAFADVTQVLIVSVNKLGPEARRLHRDAIAAARDAGARRVLYTSHMAARPDSPFAPAVDHAATEAFLSEGPGAFTSLRHGFYAESALHMIGSGFQDGEIRAPEDGPVSWTVRADLAEADAAALAAEGCLDGITPPLTASEAFTMSDIAAIASDLTGREIKRVTVTDGEWRDVKIAAGVPEPMADMLLATWKAMRRGDFAAVDPALGTLLGRAPQTMRSFLEQRLAAQA